METINTIVGWREWVSLTKINIPAIKAKIDTGAATSSLHAYKIKIFEDDNKSYVSFIIHPLQKNKKIAIPCCAPLEGFRKVKSSNGKSEKRPVIKTNLKIGRLIIPIELNLTNRDSMGMRMLIGRQALKQVLVNPSSTYLHGKLTKKTSLKIYEK